MSQRIEITGINTSSLPTLNQDESIKLLKEIKNGNQQAREDFLISNVKLVLSVIQKYYSKKPNTDDLFQVGFIGLTKAMDNFDYTIGLQFSTYAVPMIIGEIRRFLRDNSPVRISRSIRDNAYKIIQARQALELNSNHDATLEEIASTINMPLYKVNEALDAIADPMSLYDPIYHDGNETMRLMDQISDEKNTGEKWVNNIALDDAMNKLSDKEKNILTMRYFYGKTQTEISEEIGISQAQVSRLEKNAKKSLKKSMI